MVLFQFEAEMFPDGNICQMMETPGDQDKIGNEKSVGEGVWRS